LLVLGEDISSSSTGLVLVDGEDLIEWAVWTPPKRADTPRALLDFYWAKHEWLESCKESGLVPDISICEEPGGGGLGFRTVRSMAKFEGVAHLVNEERGIVTRTVKAGSARATVLGTKANVTKELAHIAARERFPRVSFPPNRLGGGDVIDAFIAAMAAPEVMRA
jgi:hypothetical protein